MTRKIIAVVVVLALFGAAGAVTYRVAKKKKLFSCQKRSKTEKRCAPTPPVVLTLPAADEKKVDVSFTGASLSDVIAWLGEQGLSFVYVPREEYAQLKVTAQMKQVPLTAAATSILKTLGIEFELTPEKILIVLGR